MSQKSSGFKCWDPLHFIMEHEKKAKVTLNLETTVTLLRPLVVWFSV